MSIYTPTAEQITLANAELAKHGTGAADHEKDASDVEIPVATVTGLHRKHYLDVSMWAELLLGELRRSNPRARFDLDIHGECIVARTNQPIDVIAGVAVRHVDALGSAIAEVDRKIRIAVTFDVTLAERMAMIVAK